MTPFTSGPTTTPSSVKTESELYTSHLETTEPTVFTSRPETIFTSRPLSSTPGVTTTEKTELIFPVTTTTEKIITVTPQYPEQTTIPYETITEKYTSKEEVSTEYTTSEISSTIFEEPTTKPTTFTGTTQGEITETTIKYRPEVTTLPIIPEETISTFISKGTTEKVSEAYEKSTLGFTQPETTTSSSTTSTTLPAEKITATTQYLTQKTLVTEAGTTLPALPTTTGYEQPIEPEFTITTSSSPETSVRSTTAKEELSTEIYKYTTIIPITASEGTTTRFTTTEKVPTIPVTVVGTTETTPRYETTRGGKITPEVMEKETKISTSTYIPKEGLSTSTEFVTASEMTYIPTIKIHTIPSEAHKTTKPPITLYPEKTTHIETTTQETALPSTTETYTGTTRGVTEGEMTISEVATTESVEEKQTIPESTTTEGYVTTSYATPGVTEGKTTKQSIVTILPTISSVETPSPSPTTGIVTLTTVEHSTTPENITVSTLSVSEKEMTTKPYTTILPQTSTEEGIKFTIQGTTERQTTKHNVTTIAVSTEGTEGTTERHVTATENVTRSTTEAGVKTESTEFYVVSSETTEGTTAEHAIVTEYTSVVTVSETEKEQTTTGLSTKIGTTKFTTEGTTWKHPLTTEFIRVPTTRSTEEERVTKPVTILAETRTTEGYEIVTSLPTTTVKTETPGISTEGVIKNLTTQEKEITTEYSSTPTTSSRMEEERTTKPSVTILPETTIGLSTERASSKFMTTGTTEEYVTTTKYATGPTTSFKPEKTEPYVTFFPGISTEEHVITTEYVSVPTTASMEEEHTTKPSVTTFPETTTGFSSERSSSVVTTEETTYESSSKYVTGSTTEEHITTEYAPPSLTTQGVKTEETKLPPGTQPSISSTEISTGKFATESVTTKQEIITEYTSIPTTKNVSLIQEEITKPYTTIVPKTTSGLSTEFTMEGTTEVTTTEYAIITARTEGLGTEKTKLYISSEITPTTETQFTTQGGTTKKPVITTEYISVPTTRSSVPEPTTKSYVTGFPETTVSLTTSEKYVATTERATPGPPIEMKETTPHVTLSSETTASVSTEGKIGEFTTQSVSTREPSITTEYVSVPVTKSTEEELTTKPYTTLSTTKEQQTTTRHFEEQTMKPFVTPEYFTISPTTEKIETKETKPYVTVSLETTPGITTEKSTTKQQISTTPYTLSTFTETTKSSVGTVTETMPSFITSRLTTAVVTEITSKEYTLGEETPTEEYTTKRSTYLPEITTQSTTESNKTTFTHSTQPIETATSSTSKIQTTGLEGLIEFTSATRTETSGSTQKELLSTSTEAITPSTENLTVSTEAREFTSPPLTTSSYGRERTSRTGPYSTEEYTSRIKISTEITTPGTTLPYFVSETSSSKGPVTEFTSPIRTTESSTVLTTASVGVTSSPSYPENVTVTEERKSTFPLFTVTAKPELTTQTGVGVVTSPSEFETSHATKEELTTLSSFSTTTEAITPTLYPETEKPTATEYSREPKVTFGTETTFGIIVTSEKLPESTIATATTTAPSETSSILATTTSKKEVENATIPGYTVPVIIVTESTKRAETAPTPGITHRSTTKEEILTTMKSTVPQEVEITTVTKPTTVTGELETAKISEPTEATSTTGFITTTLKSTPEIPEETTTFKSKITTVRKETPSYTEIITKKEKSTLPPSNLITEKPTEVPHTYTYTPTVNETTIKEESQTPVLTETTRELTSPTTTERMVEHKEITTEIIEGRQKSTQVPVETTESMTKLPKTTLKMESEIPEQTESPTAFSTSTQEIEYTTATTTKPSILTTKPSIETTTSTAGTKTSTKTFIITTEYPTTVSEENATFKTSTLETFTMPGSEVTLPFTSTFEAYSTNTEQATTGETLITTMLTVTPVSIDIYTERTTNQTNFCNSDMDCTPFETCINQQCINICAIGGRCATNAICAAQNHTAICMCPPGYSGDPKRNCLQEPLHPKAPKPCESDMDCLESEACYMSLCQDPCEFTNACADTAKCQSKMHRPICTCPMGYEGNPAIKCFKSSTMSCTNNNDCPLTEACIAHACQRPCDVHNPCAQNAICINTNHGSDCSCAEGFQGSGYNADVFRDTKEIPTHFVNKYLDVDLIPIVLLARPALMDGVVHLVVVVLTPSVKLFTTNLLANVLQDIKEIQQQDVSHLLTHVILIHAVYMLSAK
ncbi:EGF 3 domain containing protein [Asbolus verrucosus]|uniref:EGF 3 domain containing protein n=1 Tax=Asbolus verrucosus TaxID=1661398 RepID=A0A482VUD4_ASBVE|nr:EGF 3 domain containing protein [Asbolus verrucosus]